MSKAPKRDFPDPYAMNKLVRKIVKEEVGKELARRGIKAKPGPGEGGLCDWVQPRNPAPEPPEDFEHPARGELFDQPALPRVPASEATPTPISAATVINHFVDGGITDWIEAQIKSVRDEYVGEKMSVHATGKIDAYQDVLNRLYSSAV